MLSDNSYVVRLGEPIMDAAAIHQPISGFRPSTPSVDSASILAVTDAHSVVAIHFWAEWNGCDPVMDQRIQEIQPRLDGRIHFVSCDIDNFHCAELCKQCNVVNIPFLAIFVDGQQRTGIMGLLQSDELVATINDLQLYPNGGVFGSPSAARRFRI